MPSRLHPQSRGVVHHLPHRTRLRLPVRHRSELSMHRAADALRSTPGVKSVEVNHRTGSILVHHDEHPGILGALEETLQQSSVHILEALIENGNPEAAGLALVGGFLRNLFATTDNQVAHATDNMMNLRTLAPLAMLALGLERLRRGRGEDILMSVSPVVLFFYAFDLFWRFNVTSQVPQAEQSMHAAGQPRVDTAN